MPGDVTTMTEAQKRNQQIVLERAATFGLEQMNMPMGQAQQQPWAGAQVPDQSLQEQQQQQLWAQQQLQMQAMQAQQRQQMLQQLQQRFQQMVPQHWQPQVQPQVQPWQPQVQPQVQPMVQPQQPAKVAPWHQPPAPSAKQDQVANLVKGPTTPPAILEQGKSKDMDKDKDKERTREKDLARALEKDKEKDKEKKKKKKQHHHVSESDDEPRHRDEKAKLVEEVLAALESRGPQRPLPPKPEETKPDEQPQKKKWSWDPKPDEQPQKKKGAWQPKWCWDCNQRTWWGHGFGCQNTECKMAPKPFKEKGQSWQGKRAAEWAKDNAAVLDQAPKTPEVVDLDPGVAEAPAAAAAPAEEAATPAVDAAPAASSSAAAPEASRPDLPVNPVTGTDLSGGPDLV